MKIFLNGEQREVESATLQGLVGELQLAGKRIAIEVNREIVPRSAYGITPLQQGDHVEIVQAIGGG